MSLFNRFISATIGILGLFLTGAALAIVRYLRLFKFAA